MGLIEFGFSENSVGSLSLARRRAARRAQQVDNHLAHLRARTSSPRQARIGPARSPSALSDPTCPARADLPQAVRLRSRARSSPDRTTPAPAAAHAAPPPPRRRAPQCARQTSPFRRRSWRPPWQQLYYYQFIKRSLHDTEQHGAAAILLWGVCQPQPRSGRPQVGRPSPPLIIAKHSSCARVDGQRAPPDQRNKTTQRVTL